MALAHFHAGIVSRGSGRSAVDAVAYLLRESFQDLRTGLSYNYGRNARDVISSFVWLPKGAPERYRDAAALANYMESRETRTNSRTARTFEVALPHELTDKQREQLVKNFAQELTRKGLAVIAGIHKPHDHGDERNYHAHMVISTRTMDAKGFGEKLRDLDKVETLEHWRERWGELTNRKLEQHGHAARIDMRSFEKQGREGTPQVHMGPVAAALERKGIETDRGDQWRSVKAQTVHFAQAVEVESAVDRQRREDREARYQAQKQERADELRARPQDHARRGLLAALWQLARTSGASLAHALFGVDRSELMRGRTIANDWQQIPAERVSVEKPVPDPAEEKPHHHRHRQNATEPRVFVDRGKRAAPFRALGVELEGNAMEDRKDTGTAAEKTPVWSHEAKPEAAPAAPAPLQPEGETLLQRLDRQRREQGKRELTELKRPSRELDRELEL